jgi:hypothetical protein
MTLNEMLAAFTLVIEYGVDNPTAEQICEQKRKMRKAKGKAK